MNGSGLFIPPLDGTQCFTGTITAGGFTLVPAVAGKRFYVTSFSITVRPNTIAAAAAESNIQIVDASSGGTFWTLGAYIPAAAITTGGPEPQLVMTGLDYIAVQVNASLNVVTSVTLTGGGIDFNVCGGYTTATP